MNNYTINDIETLSFKEGVRQKIAMYLGSADMNGVYNAIQEIISNSVDEFYMGYGDKIHISIEDNVVTILDEARGIPFGIKEDGSNVLVDIFSKSHTGGKFDDKVYNSVAGLNGIGAKATCLSSSEFEVISYRDGRYGNASFSKGDLIDYNEGVTDHPNGTWIRFEPDKEVYNVEPIKIDVKVIEEKCRNLSYLTEGLEFIVNGKSFKATNGLVDLVKDNVKSPIHPSPIHFKIVEGDETAEVVLQWTTKKEKGFTFTNGLYHSEGGSSMTGVKTAVTSFMKKYLKEKLDGDIIRTGLVFAVSCKTPNPSFANQTKTKINNPSLRGLAQRATGDALRKFADERPQEFNTVIDFLTRMSKADEAAERARNAVLNHEKKEAAAKKKRILMPEKFKDCEKHGQDSMLIIAEGNSAVSGLGPGRNIDIEALYGIRGKIKNLLKAPLDECLENQEVSDIITLLGCGIKNKYQPNKLNYGSVAIATDADADGFAIMTLISTMFYVLMPKFIEEGRLCWLKAPLYKLSKGKQVVFAYNDEELAELKKTHQGWTQSRFKGLGEMTSDDVEKSMFHPTERRLEVLTTENIEESGEIFDLLMGPDVLPRQRFLFANADFERVQL